MTPNDRIRAMRKAARMKQADYAAFLGISQTLLSRIENNLRITPDVGMRIARATGEPLDAFVPEAAGLVVGGGHHE